MIEPEKGTSQFKIGELFDELNLSGLEIYEIEDREILKVYKTKEIWFFINTKTNMLDQLSLFSPFNEKVLGKVGIGDTLADVQDVFGSCSVNHKVHEPYDYPGISFETNSGSKSKHAVIETISVSNPYVFYG